MIYLLDTDTFIFMVRGLKFSEPKNERQRERAHLAGRLATQCRRQQNAGHGIGLSAITVAELEYGARRADNYEAEIVAVRKILAPFVCYPFDAMKCAESYGTVRNALEATGQPIGAMDLLIAAHALALEATLVTNNLAHFSRIPGLRCTNWVA